MAATIIEVATDLAMVSAADVSVAIVKADAEGSVAAVTVVASVALAVVEALEAEASAEAVVTGKPIRSLENCLLM